MDIESLRRRGMTGVFRLRPVIGLAAALLLVGCSSVPDAVNPVKWYENAVEALTGEDEEDAVAEKAQPAPGGDRDFPKLSSVPPRPSVAARRERQQIAEGLVADTEQRRYASSVARQGEAQNVLSQSSSRVAEAPPELESPAVAPALPVAPTPVTSPEPIVTAPVTPASPPVVAPVAPAPPPVTALVAPAPPPVVAPVAPAPEKMTAPSPSPPVVPIQPSAMPRVAEAKPVEIAPRRIRPVPSAAALPLRDGGILETVVISSLGVESGLPASAAGIPRTAPTVDYGASAAGIPRAASAAGGALRVATIQFANGSAGLDARDRSILGHVLAVQRERGGVIEVIGHASSRTGNMDPVRHKMVNFQVSEKRAANVARSLVKLGGRVEEIVVTARSDVEPRYYEFMPSGEAGNRRVEVFLIF